MRKSVTTSPSPCLACVARPRSFSRRTSVSTAPATRVACAATPFPIGARVIAAVDAFDALTSARVYRDSALRRAGERGAGARRRLAVRPRCRRRLAAVPGSAAGMAGSLEAPADLAVSVPDRVLADDGLVETERCRANGACGRIRAMGGSNNAANRWCARRHRVGHRWIPASKGATCSCSVSRPNS